MKIAGKTFIQPFICAVFAFVFVIAVSVSAYAEIDTSRTGNITFTITSSETAQNIGGGSIAVYRVASVDSNGTYTLEDGFTSLELDVNKLSDSDLSSSEAAENIALYINNHALTDKTAIVAVDENGSAVLSNVPTGLYVAVQNEEPEGYAAFKPFIIQLPYRIGSKLKYDLDAKPKGTAKLPVKECTVVLPVISKTVKGTDKAVNTEFRFRFKALAKNCPRIVNLSGAVENGGDVVSQSSDEIVVRTIGEDKAEVGSITFDTTGDYCFEASEINTHEPDCQYDKTVYWCKYSIGYNEEKNGLVVSKVTVKYSNANGKVLYEGKEPLKLTFDFVNYLNTPPHKDTLPQTGQIWSPMIILASIGTAAIVIGVYILKRSEKKGSNDQK